MKYFSFILFIGLIFCASTVFSDESKTSQLDLTKEQKDFAKLAKSNEEVVDAKWINEYTMVVINNTKILGELNESTASLEAELIAKLGHALTGKNICIKLLEPKRGEIAYECAGDQSGT